MLRRVNDREMFVNYGGSLSDLNHFLVFLNIKEIRWTLDFIFDLVLLDKRWMVILQVKLETSSF